MDIQTIGAALKRKLGPFPVWVWAILGGMIVYFLRQKGYFGGGIQQGDTLQPRQADATAREPITTLQPGESAYDPNTGALTTAPGGDTSTGAPGGGTGDYAQGITDLANAITSAWTDREQTGGDAPGVAGAPASHKPSALARAKAAVTRGKVGPKNTQRLKKAGYTQAQINYHANKRTPLGKPGHKQAKGSTTKHPTQTAGHKRSTTATKHPNGGRTTGHKKPVPRTFKGRTPNATAHPTTRQRPKVPLTRRAAPVAHPASTHGATAHKQAAKTQTPAHRPSAPAPRTTRSAPPPAPKPKPKKRH